MAAAPQCAAGRFQDRALRTLDRYIAGAVISGTALAIGVLLPLLGFFILADEMDQIGEHDYRFIDALLFVGLNMPRYAYELFPIATLIGALVGLGALATHSELVAMRAAGVSIARIILGAIKGGLLLVVIAVLIGEGIAPNAEQLAAQKRSAALTGQITQHTASGFWARDGDTFVQIREILSGNNLRDISIYEIGADQTLTLASHASEARYRDDEWILESIVRSRISLAGVQVEQTEQAGWDSLLSPRLLEVIVVEPQALSIWDLYHYVRFMENTNQDGRAYELALWSKLVHPLLILIMLFLAIPILLASARTSGLGTRILLGILVGIAFYIISQILVYASFLFHLNPMLAAILPPLLFFAAAFTTLRHVG